MRKAKLLLGAGAFMAMALTLSVQPAQAMARWKVANLKATSAKASATVPVTITGVQNIGANELWFVRSGTSVVRGEVNLNLILSDYVISSGSSTFVSSSSMTIRAMNAPVAYNSNGTYSGNVPLQIGYGINLSSAGVHYFNYTRTGSFSYNPLHNAGSLSFSIRSILPFRPEITYKIELRKL